jgi:hypothetical protein
MSAFLGGVGGNLAGALGVGSIGRASVTLALETRQYQAQLAEAKAGTVGATQGVAKSFDALKLAAVTGLAVGAAAFVKFGATAIQAASAENEALNKTNVVFGESSKAVTDFAQTSAVNLGISQTAALSAASTFGNLFEATGFANDAAASMSVTMVQLASDLASFNDVDPTEALAKLQSGLTGQARPLRAFGVLLSENRVKQVAYRDGIAAVGSELTDAQKVQARYNIIMEDSVRAHGDFARTASALANSQRKLKAELEDSTAEIGKALLPVAIEATHVLADLAQTLTPVLSAAFKAAAADMTPIVDTLKQVMDIAHQTNDALKQLGQYTGLAGAAIGGIGKVISTSVLQPLSSYNSFVLRHVGLLHDDADATDAAAAAQANEVGILGKLSVAHQQAAKAAKAQKDAEDALAGGMLGLVSALETLRTDQEKVNGLKQEGKRGTQDYADAVLAELQAQAAYEAQIVDLAKSMKAAGASTSDVKDKVVELGQRAGLSASDIASLWASMSSGSKSAKDNVTSVKDAVDALRNSTKNPIVVPIQVQVSASTSGLDPGSAAFATAVRAALTRVSP